MTIAVALIVSAVLLIFVVPQFEEVFSGFGADLPVFTKMIVAASRFMVSWWWLILLVLGGGIFGLIALHKRSPRSSMRWTGGY
jgi:type IV pilus assembly protein PilC